MKLLFTADIYNWDSWRNIFNEIEIWKPLIGHIYGFEGILLKEIELLAPGTNAVFRAGDTVIKIFAPKESGIDALSDYKTELFGLEHANKLNVPAPALLASGCIYDKYDFYYIITEFIDGTEFAEIEAELSGKEKMTIGADLRQACNKMNIPCADFNGIDAISRAVASKRDWASFTPNFIEERLKWLETYQPDNNVFVHGDLNPENILISHDKKVFIIDFADSVKAPPDYELAAVVCQTFEFKKAYMSGFFGEDYSIYDITEKCFRGVLMHDFGANIIKNNFYNPENISGLDFLKECIYKTIKAKKTL